MPESHINLIEVRDMSFSRDEKPIFQSINLDIKKGAITAIMGPSGIGKTTLLHLFGGQLKPGSGTISMEGQNIPTLSRSRLYDLRKRMGVLFQSGALFTDMTVYDNVAFPIREHTDLSESLIRDIVLMKLQAVGLRGARHLMPHELSGGMARRVALARAIALDPDLIMYDEPFTGQDPISLGVLVKLVRLLHDALKITTVVVSHNIEETFSIADYVYVIANAQIIAAGTPEDLRRNDSPQVRQFIDGLPDGPVRFHYSAKPYYEELLSVNV